MGSRGMNEGKRIAAGEFKAKCLRLLDEVKATGGLIITKRGEPIARLIPYDPPKVLPLDGLILSQGDLISPVGDDWDDVP